jgi:hypothetical protein
MDILALLCEDAGL